MVLRELARPFLRYGVVYVVVALAVLYGAAATTGTDFGLLVMGLMFVGAALAFGAYGAADQHLDTAAYSGVVGGSGSTDPNNFRNESSEPTVLKLALFGFGASVIGFLTLGVLTAL